jgi:hypothetical protein
MSMYDIMVKRIPCVSKKWKTYIYAVACQGKLEGLEKTEVRNNISQKAIDNGDKVHYYEILRIVNCAYKNSHKHIFNVRSKKS